jgi:hypothetical protein
LRWVNNGIFAIYRGIFERKLVGGTQLMEEEHSWTRNVVGEGTLVGGGTGGSESNQ